MEAEKNYHTRGEAEDDTRECEEDKQKENDKGADSGKTKEGRKR